MPRAKDKSNRTIAVIDRNKVYCVEACKVECGLGRPQLMAGRAAGVLHPFSKGRFRFYKGSELADWVLDQSK